MMSEFDLGVFSEELLTELIRLIDLHHRTLEGSRLHNPEIKEWWECECKTCSKVKEVISRAYDPEYLTKFIKSNSYRENYIKKYPPSYGI